MTINDPNRQRESAKYDNPIASRELILQVLEHAVAPLNFKQICMHFSYHDDAPKIALKRRLRAMEREGQIIFNKFKQYEIADDTDVILGQVIGHREGYGFFRPEEGGKDYFIPQFEMVSLIHGDTVSARVKDATDKRGRQEVQILAVVKPREAKIVGRFFVENTMAMVVPDDHRICQDIIIPPNAKNGARHGQMVVVEVTKQPSRQQNAVGQVVEVLGDHLAPGMEIQIAISQHNIPNEWPEAVERSVETLKEEVDDNAKQGRVDLTKLPLVTIDGEDARDFDDAVYCQAKASGGWRLWVAIADVSHYVRPKTALDEEAIVRGNSVYFPGQVVPMLPEKLSNGLCSLNPNVDRLCMVCEMTISAKGKLSGSKFYPAVMRSHARFTYTKVAAIIDGDEKLRQQYQALVPDLEQLHALYCQLDISRKNRGAIAFESQESRFVFNAERKIDYVEEVERNVAHKMIEECMILANVATAKFVTKHQQEGVFRVHDKPSEEKYSNFVKYLAELGISVPLREQPEPADYSMIIERIIGRPDHELIQTMLLRSMRQATYEADNIGHFGLALDAYSHFTSPIRRYPDLIIHRVIKAILAKEQSSPIYAGNKLYSYEELQELGQHCSMTERRADEATRDVADWLKCEFMQDHLGDEFDGVISTVTNFGLFVRLTEFHIEGLIHISSLPNDYFQHDEARMRLVGEKSGVVYRVGDKLRIRVAAVNLDDKKIDLMLADDKTPFKPQKGANKGKSKDKNTGKTKKHSTSSNKGKRNSISDAQPKAKTKADKRKKKSSGVKKRKSRAGRKERQAKKAGK